MVLQKGGNISNNDSIYFENDVLKVVKSLKNLGVHFQTTRASFQNTYQKKSIGSVRVFESNLGFTKQKKK